MKFRLLAVVILGFVSSCNESSDKPETVNKLRTLGVRSEPAIYDVKNPGDVNLTLFLVSPFDTDLNLEAFNDLESTYAPNIEINLDTGQNIERESHAALHIFAVKASVSSETLKTMLAQPESNGNFRYGFRIRQGDEEEKVVGNIVGSDKELAGLTEINLSSAEPAVTKSEREIEGKFPAEPTQQYRISWLASGGEFVNRRSLVTTWKEIPTSPQTLILTARGTRSGDFTYAVQDFNQNAD